MYKLRAYLLRDVSGTIGVNGEFASDLIRIDEAQPGRSKVGFKESALACAVWASYANQKRTPLEQIDHATARVRRAVGLAATRLSASP